MLLRTARDIAELIADGRRRLRWSQAELADKIGVSRQWVSYMERGRTTAEFHLVLKALHALGYEVAVHSAGATAEQEIRVDVSGTERSTQRTPLTSGGRSLGSSPERRSDKSSG